jgi:hypothetical protein
MSPTKLKNVWSQLSAVGALMLGFGVLAGDAKADRSHLQPLEAAPDSSSRPASDLSEVAVRLDGENVSISQNGGAFEPLQLGDTPEALRLKQLLRDAGAEGQSVHVPVGATIVASGGGSGKGVKPKSETSTLGAAKGK